MRNIVILSRSWVLLGFFLFALHPAGFAQSENRVFFTAATPSKNTGQNFSPWLNDNLADRVLSSWQGSNFRYIDVTLPLPAPTQLSRLSLYDAEGVFTDNPATLYAVRNGVSTYLGTFDGSRYQVWVDVAVPAGTVADAIVVHKFGNNIPQKVQVFGAAPNGAPSPPSTPTPAPTPAPVPSSGNQITVEVTFDRGPAAASSTYTDLKYGKEAVFQFEVDDNNDVLLPIADYLARGNGRPTFSDGCGNAVNYRLAAAVNSRTNYNNVDLGDGTAPGKATWTQLANFVRDGNALENHGMYHDLWGNFGPSGDVAKNLRDNLLNVYDRLKANGVDYRMRTVVRPNNDQGYVPAADQAGYLAATSQGGENGYVKYPQQVRTVDLQTLPAGFVHLGRNFSDLNDGSQMSMVQSDLATMLSGSDATAHQLYRLGTHVAPFWAAQQMFDYLRWNANDRVWVTHMDELMEYLEIKRNVVKTESLRYNKLIITLDYGNVSVNNRFRDVSLRVNSGGASIQSVSVVGADNSSYNASTGLVNVFKRQTTFADPATSWQRSSGPTTANAIAANANTGIATSTGSAASPGPEAATSTALTHTAAEPLSAYPNPFVARTTLQFTLPRSEKATLELRDLTGKLVRRLYTGTPPAEVVQTISLEGTGLSQKMYIVRLVTASKVFTKKLVLAQ